MGEGVMGSFLRDGEDDGLEWILGVGSLDDDTFSADENGGFVERHVEVGEGFGALVDLTCFVVEPFSGREVDVHFIRLAIVAMEEGGGEEGGADHPLELLLGFAGEVVGGMVTGEGDGEGGEGVGVAGSMAVDGAAEEVGAEGVVEVHGLFEGGLIGLRPAFVPRAVGEGHAAGEGEEPGVAESGGFVFHAAVSGGIGIDIGGGGGGVLEVVDGAPQGHVFVAVGVIDAGEGAGGGVGSAAGHDKVAGVCDGTHGGVEDGVIRDVHHGVFLDTTDSPESVFFLKPIGGSGGVAIEEVTGDGGEDGGFFCDGFSAVILEEENTVEPALGVGRGVEEGGAGLAGFAGVGAAEGDEVGALSDHPADVSGVGPVEEIG